MFEITDDFLEQAGFTSLQDDQKAALKQQVSRSVQLKIGDRIVNQVGEERAAELTKLMDGNLGFIGDFLKGIDGGFRATNDFKELERIGRAAGASDEEIVQEYAVLAWMQRSGIDVVYIVNESMNEAFDELQSIYTQAADAAGQRNT